MAALKKSRIFSAVFLIAMAAVIFVLLRNIPPEEEPEKNMEEIFHTTQKDPPPVSNNDGEKADNNSQSDFTPEIQIIWRDIPEYIPTELTPREELLALIHYAQNRYNGAQAEGLNIRLGRHTAADMQVFYNAIQASQEAYDQNADAREAITTLQNTIENFRRAVIDPDDRYHPFLPVIARGEDISQKFHLRAAWIATVLNIDWPSVEARGTTPAHVDMQKNELRERFNEIADLGFNAVVFQISPTGDAFFRSRISPWSAWLTGETNFTGVLLDSDGAEFDPLVYAIRLARERNIELHAWFNPYRITHVIDNYSEITLSSTGERVTSLAQIRREWEQIPDTAFYLFGDYVKLGENRYVLDPAAPGARDWIVRRVIEVVENYDIDAVHFDDYFYPSDFPIGDTFARYNFSAHADNTQGRANFRREQTERMVRSVGTALREAAPWVKFGVSPGGVWKSAAEGNTGLDGGGYNAGTGSASTTTWSNYHSSFADTRRWVIENLIDYLTPQIYWEWTNSLAPYGVIADWWGRLFHDYGASGHLRNSQGEYTRAQLYIGVGLYRMDNLYRSNPVTVPQKWRNSSGFENEGMRTLLRQEAYNLGNPNISGSMIFSQNQMRPGRGQGMRDTMEALRDTLWRYPALVPPMPHLGGTAPSRPANITVGSGFISWKNTESNTDPFVAPRYFVVYRSENEGININNPVNILAVVPAVSGQEVYTLELPDGSGGYYFAVTAVNRLHDESPPG
jgi:uncharacterized lipoprotein YddW (UPF0748 family)